MKDTIITNISAGSITFIVDENLPEPESHVEDTLSVMEIAEYNLSGSNMDDYSHMPQIVASSDSGKLYNIGQDVFYQTLLTSYFGVTPEQVRTSCVMTKDIRDKYVVTRLLWDLGLLDEACKILP